MSTNDVTQQCALRDIPNKHKLQLTDPESKWARRVIDRLAHETVAGQVGRYRKLKHKRCTVTVCHSNDDQAEVLGDLET